MGEDYAAKLKLRFKLISLFYDVHIKRILTFLISNAAELEIHVVLKNKWASF